MEATRAMWPCVRCGVPGYTRGGACRDCRSTDPALARASSRAAQADLERVAAKATALLHRPASRRTR